MSEVRNSAVAQGTLTAMGFTTVYTVPADKHLVLKSVLITNLGSGAGLVETDLFSAGGQRAILSTSSSIPVGGGYHLQTWIMLNPGDQVRLNSAITGATYWISGALLPAL